MSSSWDPTDSSRSGSSLYVIFQARILEWVAISFSIYICVCVHRYIYTSIRLCCVLVAQLCLTRCDPMGYSPLGFSVHETFQARILEWVAISFSILEILYRYITYIYIYICVCVCVCMYNLYVFVF